VEFLTIAEWGMVYRRENIFLLSYLPKELVLPWRH